MFAELLKILGYISETRNTIYVVKNITPMICETYFTSQVKKQHCRSTLIHGLNVQSSLSTVLCTSRVL